MGFLRRLFGGGTPRDNGIYLYVRCNNCGEPIRIRVNPGTDLSPVYEGAGDDEAGYELRKEILGNRCYRLIEATWRFDRRKRPIGSEIHGAKEITAAEYDAEASQPQP